MIARYEAQAEAAANRYLNRKSGAEAHFHGLVYERCGNHLLLDVWRQMTQRIQLGFAACRLTHTPKPDHAENHQLFLTLAIRDDLNAMLEELDAHLLRGLSTIRAALRGGWRSGKVNGSGVQSRRTDRYLQTKVAIQASSSSKALASVSVFGGKVRQSAANRRKLDNFKKVGRPGPRKGKERCY